MKFGSLFKKKIQGRWEYSGGFDAILFAADPDKDVIIDWSRAAIVSSRLHADIFDDEEHIIRTIINLNEEMNGEMLPEHLTPELNRRRLIEAAKKLLGKLAGEAIGKAIKLLY
ncbi:hypothetical protein ACS5UA_07330 [Brucella sp. RRSP16]|uniref:hypothetical protein n=1 Tax=Brucella TaxID=234 RepID=UPI0023618C20|nr:hypothetical protein [Brucella intermedia]